MCIMIAANNICLYLFLHFVPLLNDVLRPIFVVFLVGIRLNMMPICLFGYHLQVLRVYYDKRQQRLNRFQGKGDESQPVRRKRNSSSWRGERSPVARSTKHARVDAEPGQLDKQRFDGLPDTVNQCMGEKGLLVTYPGEHSIHLQTIQEDDHLESEEEPGQSEDEECYSFISQCAVSKMNPTRQRRFSWTDEADR